MRLFIKLLAFPCYICPLCISARTFPDSQFAKGIKKFGRICPFCNAYATLKSKKEFQ